MTQATSLGFVLGLFPYRVPPFGVGAFLSAALAKAFKASIPAALLAAGAIDFTLGAVINSVAFTVLGFYLLPI